MFDQDALTTTTQYEAASKDLFNGNIKSISQHNITLADGKPIGYAYGYDQLHRLAKMDAWKANGTNSLWQTTTASADYQERVSYDANGNITKYKRNKDGGITQDSLNYKYNTGTNQLQYITDNVAANVSATDIDNQSPNNYIYDKSGNMVADNSQAMSVSWSPYGKILNTSKAGGANLQFGYNAMQQRVVKRVAQSGDTTRTYYIRDAQGNTMGVYSRHNDSVSWREQYIFGSSRLGLYRADTLVNKGLQVISKLYEGKKNYELTNHLGNVLAVINDRKTDSLNGTVKVGFNAVVISATDYFPFGMTIDSRSYTAATTYRYGFNGKENDKETGEQDYGMRIYDPRIGKFLSVDPISKKYPELTPYQFASNTPIMAVDLDGLEIFYAANGSYLGKSGNSTQIRIIADKTIFLIVKENLSCTNCNHKWLNNRSADAYISNQKVEDKLILDWAITNQPKIEDREFVMSLFKKNLSDKDGRIFEVILPGNTFVGNKKSRLGGAGIPLAGSQLIIDGINLTNSFNALYKPEWQRSTTIHSHPDGASNEFSNDRNDPFGTDIPTAIERNIKLYLLTKKSIFIKLFDPEFYKKVNPRGMREVSEEEHKEDSNRATFKTALEIPEKKK